MHIRDMNTAHRKTNRRTADDYRAMARARARDDRDQALKAPLAGRTLDTTPAAELSAEELAERKARTARAFEGL
jgi:hypothetical protein